MQSKTDTPFRAMILNVDDYAPARYARTKVLKQAGFDVTESGCGWDALRLATERKPQLVILDIHLPDISGFEVCQRLKHSRDTAGILVLQVSATSVGASDLVHGLERGADCYLTEPIDPEVLVATVRALLRARVAEKALSLLTVQEEERRRIARELHDDIGQRLSLLVIELEKLRCTSVDDLGDLQARLHALTRQAEQITEDVRAVSHQLHPSILEDLGLEGALQQLMGEFEGAYRMPVDFVSRSLAHPVPLATATALYRITQEALRNAAKHAPGALVTVELSSTDQELRLSVRDDGPGFDVSALQQQGGLGFISMRERAKMAGGKLLLSTGVGNGTEVVAVLPWQRVTEPADP
jgi:signal transduction histidine kinase